MKSETAEELPPSRLRRFQKAEGELPRSEGSPRASLNLAHDEPGRDLCGKGTACIDVRPTEAIGVRIFGCDACLAVCTWNRFAQSARETRLAARDYVRGTPLRDFLALTDSEFRALFSKSPIKRIKRPRFLLNVCLALGNIGTAESLPALRNAAPNPDDLIAEAARWALPRIEARDLPRQ